MADAVALVTVFVPVDVKLLAVTLPRVEVKPSAPAPDVTLLTATLPALEVTLIAPPNVDRLPVEILFAALRVMPPVAPPTLRLPSVSAPPVAVKLKPPPALEIVFAV